MPGVLRILIGLSTFVIFGTTSAQGNGSLARNCKDLPALVLGTDEAGFAVCQKTCELETGKCYKLAIESTGKQD